MTALDWPTDDNELEPSRQARLDTEWAVVNALREAVGIALKGSRQPTYNQTLALAQHLDPDLFDPNESLLIQQRWSSTARRYIQEAEALQSVEGAETSALDLVEERISRLDSLIGMGTEEDQLIKELNSLHAARRELRETHYSEQQIILRDALRVDRQLPISHEGKDYRQFELPNSRILRIRILHPDRPEHLMGADLVYEHYWDQRKVVRLAAIQYKVWEDRTIYSNKRLEKQLSRLSCAFCSRDLCADAESHHARQRYRLPCCAAFLRPTDRLQSENSKFISSGYHIPVCVVSGAWETGPKGGKRITSNSIRSECVTHKVFEEMFNSGMLGSRWLTYQELEDLYQEYEIEGPDDRIVIHAQEFGR